MCDCFDHEEHQHQQECLAERALSDLRSSDIVRLEALAEDYDHDWSRALNAHDWFCNQCEGHDHFGARCKKRNGHRSGAHDASFNGMLQFLYEENIHGLAYTSSPLLRILPR